jgi:hypothetical protein
VRWRAVSMPLAVLGSFEGEVAHLSFDHSWVATVAPWGVDLARDLVKKQPIKIMMASEGGKSPEPRFWTG